MKKCKMYAGGVTLLQCVSANDGATAVIGTISSSVNIHTSSVQYHFAEVLHSVG